ncbi:MULTISPECIES: RNA polymerase sigma factor FliA [unclassified Alteromonas]|uniref:RNA polymerase sigma factor FliA n=1 Tax=unclassified Alteromonas TaxID=2614992 RepID=UPI000C657011|nr:MULTISPECIES: RNA polymerase sigma factor FliA [unclassified Alteromonas]AYA63706.1 RNA polymerase sigma factor FliA [Alteromonas sp. RKMC-009]MBT80918.1 RNA polymerase sigma factor FliA [Alteromonadaceae bacterium]MDO6476453.1 RNA polymerase sigma factor FliA [Alteromonas sp. 1_MG-2023]MEC7690986.1 RNA polymerase sigma factor FliA [Pseudomonadota bacterium]
MNSKAAAYQQQTDKSQLVERHASLVKRIAHHLMARLPASVLVDDLIQAGMIGLLEAARNFDGSKGASFETFAGIRIRGAMLDEIRKGDWTPRSVHKNSRAITEAITQVERETGRDARDTEIAAKLNVSINDYHQMLNEVNAGKLVGIEDLGVSEDVISTEQNKGNDSPLEDLMQGAFQKALAHAITTLPEREAIVLSLYYDEELNLREIGEVLEVSESRVSQIHSQAMLKLKARMQSWQAEE